MTTTMTMTASIISSLLPLSTLTSLHVTTLPEVDTGENATDRLTASTSNDTMVSNSSNPHQEAPEYIADGVIIFVLAMLSLVCFVGTTGNGLTLVAIATTRKLQTIPNMYISNLAVSDIILCGILVPFSIIGTYNRQEPPGCQYHAYPVMVLLCVSMMTLSAISVNRYTLVLKPTDTYLHWYTQLKVKLSVLLIWVLSSLANTLPLMGLGTFGYNEKFGTCMIVDNDMYTYIFAQGILHGVVFGPAMAVTAFCYFKMAKVFRESQGKVAAHANSLTSASHPSYQPNSSSKMDICTIENQSTTADSGNLNGNPTTQTTSRWQCWKRLTRTQKTTDNNLIMRQRMSLDKNRHSRTTYRVTFNLFVVWCAFAICWLPLIMTYTVDYRQQLPAATYHILVAFAYSNSAINPVLYAGLNKNFRVAYLQLLTRTCK